MVLEFFFLGLLSATSLTGLGKNRRRIVLVNLALAGILIVTPATGVLVLNNVKSMFIDAILAFGVAALLYLVTEELLDEANKKKNTLALSVMVCKVHSDKGKFSDEKLLNLHKNL